MYIILLPHKYLLPFSPPPPPPPPPTTGVLHDERLPVNGGRSSGGSLRSGVDPAERVKQGLELLAVLVVLLPALDGPNLRQRVVQQSAGGDLTSKFSCVYY